MMDYEKVFKEIETILTEKKMINIHYKCIKDLLSLTNSDEFITLLLNQHDLIDIVVSLIADKKDISQLSCQILINLSTTEIYAKILLNLDNSISAAQVSDRAKIVSNCIKIILNDKSRLANSCCMLLCNLSRTSFLANYIADCIEDTENTILKLIDIFNDFKPNNEGCELDYLALFFSNISQSSIVVEYLYKASERINCITEGLQYKGSAIQRRGIIGMLRNLSFRNEKHKWLLSSDGLNILPILLLPLVGPEEFPEEETDKLPLQIQYLPATKKREPDPDIRRMILETLLLLCSQSEGRTIMRDKNVYIILRELHKNEEDRKVLLACENVIDILIRTEEEIGFDVLNTISLPDDLRKRFEEMDNDFLYNK